MSVGNVGNVRAVVSNVIVETELRFLRSKMMNRRQKLLMLVLLRRRLRRKRRRKHRFWVRQMLLRRHDVGEFNLFKEMYHHDHESFHRYFRMAPSQFDDILSMIEPVISKHDTGRPPISAAERLATTIRYTRKLIVFYFCTSFYLRIVFTNMN